MKDVPLFLQGILFSSYLHCQLIVFVSIFSIISSYSDHFSQFSIYLLSLSHIPETSNYWR